MRPSILTPDQRVRVFVSSTLGELAAERAAVRRAVERLQLLPVMFELGARPHPPRELYRAYLAQSHVFLGIYWQRYGWVAPGEAVSGLEDEYRLCGDLPRLVYVKDPAPERESRLRELLARIQEDDRASYKRFGSPRELAQLVARDLAILLSERFALPAAGAAEQATVAGAARTALPEMVTSFVGRDREVADLSRLVGEQRLVTVVGPGGAGKSRLAVEAARRARSAFAGRVALVELTGVGAQAPAAAVPRAVVDALGVVEAASDGPVEDSTELLVRALRGPRTLLVLDNCEHVLDPAAALVARLVAECPGLHILATSREALAVPGEAQVPVSPLPEDAAIRLFADRAAAVRPGFTVTGDNREPVEEICRRLDRQPLAIELAAARVKMLPPAEIARRLDDRFRLLSSGARTAQPRQQTLHALVDWSYALLSEPERRVFARLGVFAGGIPLDGAEAVCAAGDVNPLDVLDLVGRLVDKSLVLADHDGGTPRFRLLETLRAYALERLAAAGEQDEVRRRHAGHVAGLAEAAWTGMRGPEQASWFARLDSEHDNIRAALGWTVTRDAALAQRIAAHTAWFWRLRGLVREGESWLHAALDAPGEASSALTARSQAMLALLHVEHGDLAAAEKAGREAQAGAQEPGGEPLALARMALAMVAGRRGNVDEAFHLLDLAEDDGDAWAGAATDVIRTALLAVADRTALRTVAARAVDRFTALGDRWGELDPRMLLAVDAEQNGDTDTARSHYEQCLQISRELGLAPYEAMFITHLGTVALATGDLDEAERLTEEAVGTLTRIGSPVGAALARSTLAALARRRGDTARARAVYHDLLADLSQSERGDVVATTLSRLGFLALQDGDLDQARARYRESLDLATALQHPAGTALALEGLAAVAADRDPDGAAQLLGGAMALRERSGVPVDDLDRDDVSHTVHQIRTRLGPDAFDAACAVGRALSPPDLADLARG